MSHFQRPQQPSDLLSIVIVGNDALIEALPARPIQFAHACRDAGFDVVLPESWGDELVAATTLARLEARAGEPAVFCACPIVRRRLLASGADLAPLLVTAVAPAIAAARYARALYRDRVGHLAFVGSCPAADSPEFDARYRTADFLRMLSDHGIDPTKQPQVFDAVLPPDRRRYQSLPGGCPSPETLWQRTQERVLVILEDSDLPLELAQHLLARQPVLVDVATALGCSCAGVTGVTPGRSARVAVMSLEPPRSPTPVVEVEVVPSLDDPVDTGATSAHLKGKPQNGTPASERERVQGTGSRAADVADSTPSQPWRPPIAITPPHALGAFPPKGDRP